MTVVNVAPKRAEIACVFCTTAQETFGHPLWPWLARASPNLLFHKILNLFGRFRTSKTFVGRDQLREGPFIK